MVNFKNTIVVKRLATMETWLELSAVSEGVRWGWESAIIWCNLLEI